VAGDGGLAFWAEHREQLRQSENQRATMTNFVIVIAAALAGVIVQLRLDPRSLPLSILIVLLGLYGALSSAKYHERAEYHLRQARALTRALREAGAIPDAGALLDAARDEHYRRYPRLSRIRLHLLWTGFHLAVALFGLGLIIATAVG
jgi:hypothetical protein